MEFVHVPIKLPAPSRNCVFTLIPFGCVHSDDEGFRRALFDECLEEIRVTPNCKAIGMGDYRNFLRTTARRYLKAYAGDDTSWRDLDSMVEKEARDFAKILMPIKHKLIGLAEGNHYHEFMDGTTDTQLMCKLLGLPYLDKPCFLRLHFSFTDFNGSLVLKALVHHGDWSGGASTISGDVGSAERKVRGGFSRFDIVLLGHTHRKWVMPMPEMDIPERGRLCCVERPRIIARTGCFVAAYDKCTRNYAQTRLLPPTELGYVRIDTNFYRKSKDTHVHYKFKGTV